MVGYQLKLRSHIRGVVAERRQADFDIAALLPQVCSHIRRVNAGRSAISWGQRWFGARSFEADTENWVLDPLVAEQILLPFRLCSATAYVWTHVMISIEANFLPASAPRMCERTFSSPNNDHQGDIPMHGQYIQHRRSAQQTHHSHQEW